MTIYLVGTVEFRVLLKIVVFVGESPLSQAMFEYVVVILLNGAVVGGVRRLLLV
jgi:hypothetical protein